VRINFSGGVAMEYLIDYLTNASQTFILNLF